MNKIFLFGFILVVLSIVSSCCDKNLAWETGPYQQVILAFDTTGAKGCKGTDLDSVILFFNRVYQDASMNWKTEKVSDTFYSISTGGFKNHNYTYTNITIGLNKNQSDSVLVHAGNKNFLFSDLHLVIEQTGGCKKKLVTRQHDVILNGKVFDLQKSEEIIGNITQKNGIFYLK